MSPSEVRPATTYAAITEAVDRIVTEAEIDPTVARYMVMRAAALGVSAIRSPGHAAQLLYRLADEFGGEGAD